MSDIPVIINNINRFTTTREMVGRLQGLGYTNIQILDNQSTYPPLLEWYKTCGIEVVELGVNLGQLAIYNSGYINHFSNKRFIVYTDSDIVIPPDMPWNFVDILIEKANKFGYNKAGVALQIDDLPENEYTNFYKEWEKTRYWSQELESEVYKAEIDTTLCIIRPNIPFSYEALRIAGKMTCKHLPWYTDFKNLTPEEAYYLENSADFSTYKRFYNNYKASLIA